MDQHLYNSKAIQFKAKHLHHTHLNRQKDLPEVYFSKKRGGLWRRSLCSQTNYHIELYIQIFQGTRGKDLPLNITDIRKHHYTYMKTNDSSVISFHSFLEMNRMHSWVLTPVYYS